MEKKKRGLSRQFKIYVYGEKEEDVVVLNLANYGLGNDKDSLALWEADNILSSYWSQMDFINNINQFIPFEPARIGMGTLKTKNRAVIINDGLIKTLTDELINRNLESAKDAKISETDLGRKALNDVVRDYDKLINNDNQRKIFAALYKAKDEEMETYHLDAILRCSACLRYDCSATLSNYIDANRGMRLYYALDNYNEFRDAYMFLKRFKKDYSIVEEAVKDDKITSAKVKMNADRTGYSFEIKTAKHGNMVVSSSNKIVKNVYKDILDMMDLTEEELREVNQNDEPVKYNSPDFAIPDEEWDNDWDDQVFKM